MRATVTVYKTGLTLEADLSKLTRQIQKNESCSYHVACQEAEKRLDYVQHTQVIHTESKDVNFDDLGYHISKGAPFSVEKTS